MIALQGEWSLHETWQTTGCKSRETAYATSHLNPSVFPHLLLTAGNIAEPQISLAVSGIGCLFRGTRQYEANPNCCSLEENCLSTGKFVWLFCSAALGRADREFCISDDFMQSKVVVHSGSVNPSISQVIDYAIIR